MIYQLLKRMIVTGKAVGETILYAMLNRSKIAMTTIKVTA